MSLQAIKISKDGKHLLKGSTKYLLENLVELSFDEFVVLGLSPQILAYLFAIAPTIPAGKEVKSSCSNPLCCNPAHLFLADAKQPE
jgi:hypothetical protein